MALAELALLLAEALLLRAELDSFGDRLQVERLGEVEEPRTIAGSWAWSVMVLTND